MDDLKKGLDGRGTEAAAVGEHVAAVGEAAKSTGELAKKAIKDVGALMKSEVAMAKDELTTDIRAVKRPAVAFGVAGITAVLGLEVLVISYAAGTNTRSSRALFTGLGLLAVAGVAAVIGIDALPKRAPLERTRMRIGHEIDTLKAELT
ncbi:MAG: hypothetical protein NVSMB1_00780 [Polyangiales bacterium]